LQQLVAAKPGMQLEMMYVAPHLRCPRREQRRSGWDGVLCAKAWQRAGAGRMESH
jgi:hypothetical protein